MSSMDPDQAHKEYFEKYTNGDHSKHPEWAKFLMAQMKQGNQRMDDHLKDFDVLRTEMRENHTRTIYEIKDVKKEVKVTQDKQDKTNGKVLANIEAIQRANAVDVEQQKLIEKLIEKNEEYEQERKRKTDWRDYFIKGTVGVMLTIVAALAWALLTRTGIVNLTEKNYDKDIQRLTEQTTTLLEKYGHLEPE